jgi:hypothetical protein
MQSSSSSDFIAEALEVKSASEIYLLSILKFLTYVIPVE